MVSPDGARFESHGDTLFAHPPWQVERRNPETGRVESGGSGVAYASFAVPLPSDGQIRFVCQVAMDQGAVGPDRTDGVTFGVTVRAKGQALKCDLHNATDERRPLELGLTRLAGQTVDVELTVHPGPNRSPSFDWARWFRPRVERSVRKEGLLAVRGAEPWELALGRDGQLSIETNGGEQQMVAPVPGTVLLLRERPAAVELPVDLAARQLRVGFLAETGSAIEPAPFAGMGPGRAAVGGVERDGLGAHPPDHGRTIALLPMSLPSQPAVFRSWVGIRDGSQSTGVLFIVEVNGHEVARRRMLPGNWESLEVDLSRWAAEPVVLSLVTDSAGPFNFDWAHWGQPRIEGINDEG
jgi:hypothetical protein